MRTLTPLLRRALRIALPSILAASCLTATPSSAGPMPMLGEGVLVVLVQVDGSGFNVCVEGDVPPSTRLAGTWLLAISGVRVDASGSTWVIDPPPWTTTAWSVDHCEPVLDLGYPSGVFTVDFSYLAAGEYVLVHSFAVAKWDMSTGPSQVSVDLTPP